MNGEEWRVVSDTDGQYEVSSHGRVLSWATRGPGPNPRLLACGVGGKGYRRLTLCLRGGLLKHTEVHRLVCAAFNGPRPEPGMVVRHLDGDQLNNHATNLAWGTPAENVGDTVRMGRILAGEQHGHAKLTEARVREMRLRHRDGEAVKSLAAEFGVAESVAGKAIRGTTWKSVA